MLARALGIPKLSVVRHDCRMYNVGRFARRHYYCSHRRRIVVVVLLFVIPAVLIR